MTSRAVMHGRLVAANPALHLAEQRLSGITAPLMLLRHHIGHVSLAWLPDGDDCGAGGAGVTLRQPDRDLPRCRELTIRHPRAGAM